MLNVNYKQFMLSVVMLKVFMLSVVALTRGQYYKTLRISNFIVKALLHHAKLVHFMPQHVFFKKTLT
jgi:hypothetical protein